MARQRHRPTEPQIVSAILRQRCEWGARGTAMVHYTPSGWWECDVAHFSDAGYLTEYEVKTTRADFMRDSAKERRHGGALDGGALVRQNKHRAAAAGHGPKRFWFVTPEGLIQPTEVPPFAGLLEASWRRRLCDAPEAPLVLCLRPMVHAPTIRGARKFPDRVVQHCRGVAYHRLIRQIAELHQRLEIEGSDHG